MWGSPLQNSQMSHDLSRINSWRVLASGWRWLLNLIYEIVWQMYAFTGQHVCSKLHFPKVWCMRVSWAPIFGGAHWYVNAGRYQRDIFSGFLWSEHYLWSKDSRRKPFKENRVLWWPLMCVCDKGKWKTVPSYAAQKACEKHNIGLS